MHESGVFRNVDLSTRHYHRSVVVVAVVVALYTSQPPFRNRYETALVARNLPGCGKPAGRGWHGQGALTFGNPLEDDVRVLLWVRLTDDDQQVATGQRAGRRRTATAPSDAVTTTTAAGVSRHPIYSLHPTLYFFTAPETKRIPLLLGRWCQWKGVTGSISAN